MKMFDTTPKPGMPVRSKLFYKAIIRMARAWEKLAVYNGHVDWSAGMPTIVVDTAGTSAGSTMSYSDWAFGFSISGTEVTVSMGEVHPKKQTPIVLASKKITLTADHQYVWVEHVLETDQAVIQGPGLDRPVSDDIMYRVWLHQFRLINNVASLEQVGHVGNIYIFGNY